ncbi:MAG: carbon-nitrogen hydrolase family protein [Thermoplasmatota archaeon]
MKVALHSANPRLGDVAENVATIAQAAAKDGADLVVFPEMFLSGYAIGDDAQRLALSGPSDPRLAPLFAAARENDATLIAGAPWSPRRGITHNAALLVAPDGHSQWYAKRCLPTFTTFREGLFFAPGRESPVWTTPVGKLGIHICYDIYFPEHQKRQVLDGADILVNISASPAPSRRFFETLLEARAIENASFMLYANCVGPQDGLVFWGGSRVVGPRGQTVAALEPYREGRVVADIDLDDVVAAREFRPTLRDSHPEDLENLAGHPVRALGT